MNYEDITTRIGYNTVITFQEYSLDRHERKKLTMSIDPTPVEIVIPANVPIGRVELEKYYGTDLSDLDYCQLSCVNGIRLILRIGVTEEGQPIYKPVLLNKDFFTMGLQVINIISETRPSYLQEMLI